MILYGRNLSPFTRRVAIWLDEYGLAARREPLAATDPAHKEAMRAVHPGIRVPALELDDGTVLIGSGAICDWLDEGAGDRRLVPASGLARRDCLQEIAMAEATAEKAVAMVYEKNRRPEAFHWADWQARLAEQIEGGLAAMEAATPEAGFRGGARPDGADYMRGIVFQFVEATNPWLLARGTPRLAGLAARLMERAAFSTTHPSA